MNFIKNTLIIIISSLIVYYFKLYSVLKGGCLFRKLFEIPVIKNNIVSNNKTGVFYEGILYIIVILSFYLFFKIFSKYFKIDKIFLLIVVISPILFELSAILYDKSCDKPWYHFNKLLWYLPMRLVLWIFLYWFFKDLMPMLKSKRNLVIIGFVFLIFHVFKIYSKYNF
jgi:hypothetical protein